MTDKDIKEEILEETGETAEQKAGTDAEGKAEADESSQAKPGADEADANSEKEAKEEPAEDADTKYLRLMADFQNYKKRAEKEKKDLYSYANEKLMGDLLAVIDNFDRALAQEATEGFREGMEMIFKQLCDVLTGAGLAEIEALGEEFDPNVHNAVMTEDSEEYDSGKVSGVMQKGYTLNGKVIRPSMVKVVN